MSPSGEKPEQLALQLPQKPSFADEDFIVHGGNQAAYDYLSGWPNGAHLFTLLIGPPKSGKSHLASLWVERMGAILVEATALEDINQQQVHLECGAICVEGVDKTHDLTDQALFHFLNSARVLNCCVLMTTSEPLGAWSRALPDLLSRMKTATPLHIDQVDETGLRQLLVKLLADRDLSIDAHVVELLSARMDRSYPAIAELADTLDRLSLARRRPVNRDIALRALKELSEDALPDVSE